MLKNIVGHFLTITRHKTEVMKNCFRIGLYLQGILHDNSKYSPQEFLTGIRYYTGHRSPNTVERLETGLSTAWLHHKGRNKHHYEYWCDYDLENKGLMTGLRMPYRYVAEMFCDRVAASKVYKGKDYKDSSAWDYYEPQRDTCLIHKETKKELEDLLLMLRDKGEDETFLYLKNEVRRRRKEKDYF